MSEAHLEMRLREFGQEGNREIEKFCKEIEDEGEEELKRIDVRGRGSEKYQEEKENRGLFSHNL